jgi:hypothetical protein
VDPHRSLARRHRRDRVAAIAALLSRSAAIAKKQTNAARRGFVAETELLGSPSLSFLYTPLRIDPPRTRSRARGHEGRGPIDYGGSRE